VDPIFADEKFGERFSKVEGFGGWVFEHATECVGIRSMHYTSGVGGPVEGAAGELGDLYKYGGAFADETTASCQIAGTVESGSGGIEKSRGYKLFFGVRIGQL